MRRSVYSAHNNFILPVTIDTKKFLNVIDWLMETIETKIHFLLVFPMFILVGILIMLEWCI